MSRFTLQETLNKKTRVNLFLVRGHTSTDVGFKQMD
jgi:hypothetical protein